NGSEHADLHIYDVATGKALPDTIEHVQNGTAGGSIVFTADNSGIYYTRYPRKGDAHAAEDGFWQQVWFHKIGAPAASDVYCFGKELPRIAEIVLFASPDGKWIAANVANGDGGEQLLWLRSPDNKWAPLSTFADEIKLARFGVGQDATLYLLSTKGAPKGQVLALPLGQPLTAAKVVVPASEGAIQELQATATRLWTTEIFGGPTRLRSFRLDGSDARVMPTPPVSNVAGLTRLDGDDLLAIVLSYLEPEAWYRFAPALPKPHKTVMAATSPVDFSGVEARRENARSKDGTQVPFTLICKKGTPRNGKNPTLLTGYGGFDISMTPGFNPLWKLWLEQGGVIAIANLRGGGDFGESWHQAGMLTHKQNVFDDFIAVAKKLVADKWTQPAKLGIEGGSNGGLLMGAVLTQQPQLFGAVVSAVGIYDMLRVELSTNGAFNVTEFGSVKDPAQRDALYAYSPYHHVVDGTAYPAVLMTTGDNDPRVDPMNSRKMIARLQAATSSKAPILLRTSASAGHGMGTALDEQLEEAVDTFAFLFAELGVKYKPVTPQH
ncbi:MAG TPA: prolyl oligopeptidase family serine peptidase, partial [Polyangia bacterium]|nr:prolyl oligopeptidase family serine peptidase [Polyangia bacterium]